MTRWELEEKLEEIIKESGVDPGEVIDTLAMMLERYEEEYKG